ncbi:hypothetical protein PV04_00955 [Phialophora macrospora]|uniref:Uncharacterized protein n=1 Tax=Phialophora macrospora TaxID=1851006 RepID=A0A0D2G1V6_9EURO|nr:hypothetical protein PV04_00955 [Phialophora macrospora]
MAALAGSPSLTVMTCEGTAYLGSTTCDSPWAIETVVPGLIPGTQTRVPTCGSWTGFVTTTPPVPPHTLQCATATTSAVEVYTSGGPLSPFFVDSLGDTNKKDTSLWHFCEYLTDRTGNFTIDQGGEKGGPLPGVCEIWDYPGFFATKFDGYPVVFQVAFDFNGCASPTDKYRNGVYMPDYGTDDCYHAFQDLLLKKCLLSEEERELLKLGLYPAVGGMLFKDCMRWTIMAPRLDLAPRPIN